MPLNRQLFDALNKKTGFSARHINRLIEKIAVEQSMPRNLAALTLARQHGIAVHRFASNDELAELRGSSRSGEAPRSIAVAAASTPASRRAKAVPLPTRNNSIFVVHGRDSKLTEDMYQFLRAIGLNPMEWNDAIKAAKGGANPIVGDVIHDAMKKVQGVMVLLSSDEEARLKTKFAGKLDKKRNAHKLDGQPRPNVIFEAGLALGAHS